MGVREHTRVCSSTDEIPPFQLVGSLSVPLYTCNHSMLDEEMRSTFVLSVMYLVTLLYQTIRIVLNIWQSLLLTHIGRDSEIP